MKTTLLRFLLACIIALLAISNGGLSGNTGIKSPSNHPPPAGAATEYQQLPLFFETNIGQADARVRFLARGEGYTLYVTPTETVLVEGQTVAATQPPGTGADIRTAKPTTLRMTLVDANAAPKVMGVGELPGKVNYLIGNDARKWHTGVAIYSQVRTEQVYPGVDLLFHGDQQRLEYDFVLAPGADPRRVRFRVTGADGMEIDARGDLVLRTGATEFRMHKPLIYQESGRVAGSERMAVEGGFALEETGEIGFRVGGYDRNKALVIDPGISYATFLGGAGNDQVQGGIALDTSNPSAPKIYVRGLTTDPATFPEASTLIGASPGAQAYVYVAKIDPKLTGPSSLDYLTFIGGKIPFTGATGACFNGPGTISLDTSGGLIEPVISAVTNCKDYPQTAGTPSTGDRDFAVTRLRPSGAALDHSMLFGGSGKGGATGDFFPVTTVNSAGEIILTGGTTSKDLPTSPNAYAKKLNNGGGGFSDCFVAKLNRSFAILYLTYLNVGANITMGQPQPFCAATEDASGQIAIGGWTASATAFNAAGGANGFQTTLKGLADAFLMKLNPSLSGTAQLKYATYIGGGGVTTPDAASAAVSAAGIAILAGNTTSGTNPPDIPLRNAYQTTNGATGFKGIGWATIVDTTKTGAASLICSTYFGGTGGDDKVQAVTADLVPGDTVDFRLVLGGQTSSANFPTKNALQSALIGGQNGFISILSAPLTSAGPAASLLFSTYIGGGVPAQPHQNETIPAIQVDAQHTIYAAGRTVSMDFFGHTNPATTVNGFQTACSSCAGSTPMDDTVVFALPMTLQATATAVVSSQNPSTVGQAVTFTAKVTTTASGTPGGTVTFLDGAVHLGSGVLTGGTAKFTTSALAAGTHSIKAVYGGNAAFAGSTSPTLSQVVKQTTTTTLKSSANPSTVGQAVTFTATVTAATGIPTGTVTFMDGTTKLGTGTLNAGTAKFTTTALAKGTHSITAVYGGSANYAGSTSAVLKQAVQ
jgi:hypothetical protein